MFLHTHTTGKIKAQQHHAHLNLAKNPGTWWEKEMGNGRHEEAVGWMLPDEPGPMRAPQWWGRRTLWGSGEGPDSCQGPGGTSATSLAHSCHLGCVGMCLHWFSPCSRSRWPVVMQCVLRHNYAAIMCLVWPQQHSTPRHWLDCALASGPWQVSTIYPVHWHYTTTIVQCTQPWISTQWLILDYNNGHGPSLISRNNTPTPHLTSVLWYPFTFITSLSSVAFYNAVIKDFVSSEGQWMNWIDKSVNEISFTF